MALRKYRNVLIGAGSIASVFPDPSLKRHPIRRLYHPKGDTQAFEMDWKAIGNDFRAAITLVGHEQKAFKKSR